MSDRSREMVKNGVGKLVRAKRTGKHILVFIGEGGDVGIECRILRIVRANKAVYLRVLDPQGNKRTVEGETPFWVIN